VGKHGEVLGGILSQASKTAIKFSFFKYLQTPEVALKVPEVCAIGKKYGSCH